MKYLKIAMELSGLILFSVGAITSLLMYAKYKRSGVKNAAIYLKTNPGKTRKAKIAGVLTTAGFWLMLTGSYIKY